MKQFTKEDFLSKNIAVVWEKEHKDKIQKFFKEVFPKDNRIGGIFNYYYAKSKDNWSCTDDNTFDETYSITQLIEEKMEKEIIGYKLIKPEYKEAAYKITTVSSFSSFSSSDGIAFNHGTYSYNKLKEAGVLDLWFEPVYKKDKKTITDSKGRTAIVKKDKLLVANGHIYIEDLEQIRDFNLNIGYDDWKVTLKSATFKIGCWDDVTLEDINMAIKAIESLN